MKDKMFALGKIISLIVFLFVLSMMGMASGKPIMVLAYAGFFVVVMLIVFFFVKKHQRHFEIVGSANPKIGKITGIALIILAVLIPLIVYQMQVFSRVSDTNDAVKKVVKSTAAFTDDVNRVNALSNDVLAKATLLDTLSGDPKLVESLSKNYKLIGTDLASLKSMVDANAKNDKKVFDSSEKSRSYYLQLGKTLAEADSVLPDIQDPLDSISVFIKDKSTDVSGFQSQMQVVKNSITGYPEKVDKAVSEKIKGIASKLSLLLVFNLLLVSLLWAALIAACVFGVYLINHRGNKLLNKVLGYLIIIIASAVPALMVIPYDRTTTGIGSIYWIAVLVAVLAWSGFNLFLNKE
jgi:uncharacterized protein YoxC